MELNTIVAAFIGYLIAEVVAEVLNNWDTCSKEGIQPIQPLVDQREESLKEAQRLLAELKKRHGKK